MEVCVPVNGKRKRILVSFPVGERFQWVNKWVMMKSWEIMRDPRYKVEPVCPSHTPFENNLNHTVLQFLREGQDYWLSIDSDNPPMGNPLDLIELDKDIIALPTPVWKNNRIGAMPISWNAYDYHADKDTYRQHFPREGLQRVDAFGTGCFLIARRVFEDKRMQQGPFNRKWNLDGTQNKGNDLMFSERARSCGFEIYAHFDYPAMHFKELELNSVIREFRQFKDIPT